MRMRLPKRWVLVLAGCAIAAVMLERASVLYQPKAKLAIAAESESLRCPSPHIPQVLDDDATPSVTQPGGIDPLGVSSAIRSALGDCP
jgi:hypothetical protein